MKDEDNSRQRQMRSQDGSSWHHPQAYYTACAPFDDCRVYISNLISDIVHRAYFIPLNNVAFLGLFVRTDADTRPMLILPHRPAELANQIAILYLWNHLPHC
jgi:hypothetical protein